MAALLSYWQDGDGIIPQAGHGFARHIAVLELPIEGMDH
jgi:hypothetical protein